MKPIIFLAADHGGFELKEEVKSWLQEWKYDYTDLGAHEFKADDDYPDYAFQLAEQVSKETKGGNEDVFGILVCRSGGGMTIAANKVKGVRAVPVYNPQEAAHARNDNHANVISLSGDWTDQETAYQTVKAFLQTPPSAESRHIRRLVKIIDYEADHSK